MEWTPLLTGAMGSVSTVWGSGPNNVWIGGSDGVRHFNGATWAPVGALTAVRTLWLSRE